MTGEAIHRPAVVLSGNFGFPGGGGPGQRVLNLALGLEEAGASVHVLSVAPTGGDGTTRGTVGRAVEYACIWGRASDARPRTRPRLRNQGLVAKVAWFKEFLAARPRALEALCAVPRVDLLVLYGRNYSLLSPLAAAARQRGAAVVLDVVEPLEQFGGLGGRLSPVYWDWVAGTSLLPRRVHGLCCITRGLLERATNTGCDDVMLLPPLAHWPPPAATVPGPKKGPFRLVWVSSLVPRDAPEWALRVVRLLRERQPRCVVELAGRYGETSNGQEVAAALAAAGGDSLRLLGTLTGGELEKLLGGADAFLLTRRDSEAERLSFPTRLLEFLQRARPVIVSPVGDIPHHLRHMENAIFLDSSAESAVDAIGWLATDPGGRARLGMAGWRQGAASFDRRTHAARLLEFSEALRRGEGVRFRGSA